MRTLPYLALLALVAVAFVVPGASAAPSQNCVKVSSGDPITVSVSPSGCQELGRPVYNIWNEQCAWLTSNPLWPPQIQCNPMQEVE